jgi:putative chitinase
MPTDDQLRNIMPALPAAKRAALLPFLQQAIDEFGIDAPARQAAFLAQLAHESAQLKHMEELWGPTPAQKKYEPPSTVAERLGNTQAGDGFRFKGRGPIQLTGRANYQRFGAALGLDLVADPPRAATPEVGFRIAGLFWQRNGLNALADLATADAFRRITRRINGGENGLADRERFYAVARTVLGVAAMAGPAMATRGAPVRAGAPAGTPIVSEAEAFERGSESLILAGLSIPREGRAARKPAGRKAAAGRPAKKPAAKKAAPRTRAARKGPARKAATKKVTVKRAASKKATVKRAASKKAARTPVVRRRLAKKR